MTDSNRMVVWLQEAMDAAERIARNHRHACGDWEYDHMCGEIRDHCNGGTVAFVGKDDPAGEHMALHDPAAVLRRIAADRKTLDLHRNDLGKCAECGQGYELMDWGPDFPCRTIRLLAEGWGWTEETT